MALRRLVFVLLPVLFLSSCAKLGPKPVSSAKIDGPPGEILDPAMLLDAVPRLDPVTRAGNKNPYTINGKTYHLLPSAAGYKEVGGASWYGTKFHGNRTSNGEIYSLYEMTAAHKTLPIPAYARVTNLANNRSVIVRINDRGPFHSERIIDLSYAAALKLGYAEIGTAEVEVSVIDPLTFKKVASSSSVALAKPAAQLAVASQSEPPGQAPPLQNVFLQVGAYSTYASALQHREEVSGLTPYPIAIRESVVPSREAALFKVLIGPIVDRLKLQQLREQLLQLGRFQAFVVYESIGPAS